MRGLYAKSIWAHDAIPPAEWKYRNLKRVMFPVIDFLFILGGFSAARYGVPAISEFFPDLVVDLFSYALSLVAAVCFIGVLFPRLWPMEIAGKVTLLTLMTGYFVSLLLLTAAGEGNRGFVLIVAAIALCPIVWRLSLLATEWQTRRLLARGA